MQELNHNTTGDSETGTANLNVAPESCQLANSLTPRSHNSKAPKLYGLGFLVGMKDGLSVPFCCCSKSSTARVDFVRLNQALHTAVGL